MEAANPAAEMRELQGRLRRLTGKLRTGGEAYHVELDAIATRLGALAMVVEGLEPVGRAWRALPAAARRAPEPTAAATRQRA